MRLHLFGKVKSDMSGAAVVIITNIKSLLAPVKAESSELSLNWVIEGETEVNEMATKEIPINPLREMRVNKAGWFKMTPQERKELLAGKLLKFLRVHLQPATAMTIHKRLMEEPADHLTTLLQPQRFRWYLNQHGAKIKKYRFGSGGHASNVEEEQRIKLYSPKQERINCSASVLLHQFCEDTYAVTQEHGHSFYLLDPNLPPNHPD